MSVDVGDRVIVRGGNDARKAPAVVIDVHDDGEGAPAAIVIYERDDPGVWADLDDRMRRETAEVLTRRDEYIDATHTYVYPADQLRRVLWVWEPSEGPAANGGAGT